MAVSADDMKYDHSFKILLVGDSGAGKSSILHRLLKLTPASDYTPTIGVEFGSKIIQVKGKKAKLQIWDTAGQERFRAVTSAYYRGSHGFLVVVSVRNNETAQVFTDRAKTDFNRWLTDIRKNTDNAPMFLIINGADLITQDRALIQSELLEYAKQNNAHGKIFFVSAKTGEGIDDLFVEVSRVGIQNTGEQKSSEVVKPESSKGSSFFKALWNGVSSFFSAVIGGISIGVAEFFILNPLSLVFHTLSNSHSKEWKRLIIILISPLVTVFAGLFYAGLASKKGWNKGLVGAFAWYGKELQKEGAEINFNHVMASWLVLGITAAVVLAVLFPPIGLAAMIPSTAVAVGLGGVSTALLAVIAGAATIAIGSLVYGLTNLAFGGEKVKGQSAAKSSKTKDDQKPLLDKSASASAGPAAHPAAGAGLAGGDVNYQSPVVGARQRDVGRDMPPPASAPVPVLQ